MKKNQKMEIKWVKPGDLRPHPANREFSREGEAWETFVEGIRDRGVVTPCLVRVAEDGCAELIAGHRRTAAAEECGLEVPVMFCRMDAKEALEMVLLENLERENLNPVQEAEAVRHLLAGLEVSEEELAMRLRRSLDWVKTRQGLLELGDEVREAVAASREDRHHLPLGSVREILRVPPEWRPEAVQMVLHPSFQDGSLGPEEAREVIRRCLLEPRRKEQAWEGARKEILKAWKERLNDEVPDGQEVLVRVAKWGEEVRGGVPAEQRVPLEELLPTAPEVPGGLRWLHVAAKHGLAAVVCPGSDGEPVCVVGAPLLRQAEESLAEFVRNGGEGEVWLVTKFGRVAQVQAPEPDNEGPVETVIEQRMDHRRWVDTKAYVQLVTAAARREGYDSLPEWLQRPMKDEATAQMLAMTAMWVMGEDVDGALECGTLGLGEYLEEARRDLNGPHHRPEGDA